MQYPSSACLLQAWEVAVSEHSVRRPLSWLSAAFGWSRQDLEQLSLGERDRLVLQARSLLFGTKMSGLTICNACQEQVEFEVPMRALLNAHSPKEPSITVDGVGFRLGVRLITAGDVEAVAGSRNPRESLFQRCVTSGTWEDAAMDRAIRTAGEKLADADPLANITIDLCCPACSANFAPRFDPWRFFWDELEIWARRVFQQIHTLATAYGWTEDQILALSPSRRAQYLQMIRG